MTSAVRTAQALGPASNGVTDERPSFAPLLDAKAASTLLAVPHTWLLEQARAGRVPHHRLGHYVRFSAEELLAWLTENRIEGPAR